MEVAPDRLNGIIKADYDRWIAIIREAGIRRSNDWRLATEKSSNYSQKSTIATVRGQPSEAGCGGAGAPPSYSANLPANSKWDKSFGIRTPTGLPVPRRYEFFHRLGLRQLTPVEQ